MDNESGLAVLWMWWGSKNANKEITQFVSTNA